MEKPSHEKVEAMPEIPEIDEDDYACGHDAGTLYGPEKYLDAKMKPFRRMNYQEYLAYVKKVDESEGFDVDGCTGCMLGRIASLHRGSHEWEVAEKVTLGAIAKLGKMMAKHIEFVHLMKANVQPVRGGIYYLTFEGTTNGMKQTYKAKVWYYLAKGGIECQVLHFADESEEKDLEAQNIKFCLSANDGSAPIVGFKNETIAPKSVLRDGFLILVEELKRENPELTYAKARREASRKWKQYRYPEKRPYIKEAWVRFKKKNAKYYPEYSSAGGE